MDDEDARESLDAATNVNYECEHFCETNVQQFSLENVLKNILICLLLEIVNYLENKRFYR